MVTVVWLDESEDETEDLSISNCSNDLTKIIDTDEIDTDEIDTDEIDTDEIDSDEGLNSLDKVEDPQSDVTSVSCIEETLADQTLEVMRGFERQMHEQELNFTKFMEEMGYDQEYRMRKQKRPCSPEPRSEMEETDEPQRQRVGPNFTSTPDHEILYEDWSISSIEDFEVDTGGEMFVYSQVSSDAQGVIDSAGSYETLESTRTVSRLSLEPGEASSFLLTTGIEDSSERHHLNSYQHEPNKNGTAMNDHNEKPWSISVDGEQETCTSSQRPPINSTSHLSENSNSLRPLSTTEEQMVPDTSSIILKACEESSNKTRTPSKHLNNMPSNLAPNSEISSEKSMVEINNTFIVTAASGNFLHKQINGSENELKLQSMQQIDDVHSSTYTNLSDALSSKVEDLQFHLENEGHLKTPRLSRLNCVPQNQLPLGSEKRLKRTGILDVNTESPKNITNTDIMSNHQTPPRGSPPKAVCEVNFESRTCTPRDVTSNIETLQSPIGCEKLKETPQVNSCQRQSIVSSAPKNTAVKKKATTPNLVSVPHKKSSVAKNFFESLNSIDCKDLKNSLEKASIITPTEPIISAAKSKNGKRLLASSLKLINVEKPNSGFLSYSQESNFVNEIVPLSSKTSHKNWNRQSDFSNSKKKRGISASTEQDDLARDILTQPFKTPLRDEKEQIKPGNPVRKKHKSGKQTDLLRKKIKTFQNKSTYSMKLTAAKRKLSTQEAKVKTTMQSPKKKIPNNNDLEPDILSFPARHQKFNIVYIGPNSIRQFPSIKPDILTKMKRP